MDAGTKHKPRSTLIYPVPREPMSWREQCRAWSGGIGAGAIALVTLVPLAVVLLMLLGALALVCVGAVAFALMAATEVLMQFIPAPPQVLALLALILLILASWIIGRMLRARRRRASSIRPCSEAGPTF